MKKLINAFETIDRILFMSIYKNYKIYLLFLFLVNFITKILYIGHPSVWLDEVHEIAITLKSIPEIISYSTQHPNGLVFTLILDIWTYFFGITEISARMPSAIFASFTAIVIFAIGKRHLNIKTAVFASLLFTFSTVNVNYAQEVRNYALLNLLVGLSFLFFLNYTQTLKRKWLIGYALIISLMLNTHIFSITIIGIQSFLLLLEGRKLKKMIFPFILAQSFAFGLLAIWLFFNNWIGGNETNWGVVPGYKDLEYVLLIYLNSYRKFNMVFFEIIIALSIILMVLYFIKKNRQKIHAKRILAVFLWSLIPLIFVFILSYVYNPRFYLRYMLFATLGMYLLIPFVITLIFKRKEFLISLLFLVFFIPFLKNFKMKLEKDEPWRKVADFVKTNHSDSTLTLLCSGYTHFAFSYYYDRAMFYNFDSVYHECAKENIYFFNNLNDFKKRNFNLEKYNSVALVLAHNLVVDNTNSLFNFFSTNYRTIESFNTPRVKAFIYDLNSKPIIDTLFYDFEDSIEHKSIVFNQDAYSGNHCCQMKDKIEYSYTFKSKLDDLHAKGFKMVEISARVKYFNQDTEAKLVYQINDQNGKSSVWEGYDIRNNTKMDEWNLLTLSYPLPTDCSNCEVNVYLWNVNKNKVLMDDLLIRFW